VKKPEAQRFRVALCALIAGAVAIGLAPILVRWSEAGPSATAFWRLGLSLPFFWLWRSAERRGSAATPAAHLSRNDVLTLILPGLCFACDLTLWHWSIKLTSVANATLLANMAPIVVSIVAWVWLGERFRWPFVLGLVLALAGAAALVRASFDLGGTQVRGDLVGLLSAVFYASYQLAVKRARARFSAPRIMVWSMPAACAVLAVISTASGEQFAAVTAVGWLVLIALGFVSQFAGQGLIVHALAHLPSSFASVSLLVQPVAAALFAWVLLSEHLGTDQLTGGVLVLAGIYLARTGSRTQAGGETDVECK
jgi:drug/metabolite transporter (DMT)-like permease